MLKCCLKQQITCRYVKKILGVLFFFPCAGVDLPHEDIHLLILSFNMFSSVFQIALYEGERHNPCVIKAQISQRGLFPSAEPVDVFRGSTLGHSSEERVKFQH